VNEAPELRVREVRFFEGDVRLRLPFRFGVATLTEAPQAYVRVRVAASDGREAWGQAAELLAPKWFDKDLTLTNEQNFDQLRVALGTAAALYRDAGPASAFGLHAQVYPEQLRRCAARRLNPLVASFGPALLDRAILDALGRLEERSVFSLARANRIGLDARLTPDLDGFDIDAFLRERAPARTLYARHTVGIVDPLTADDLPDGRRLDDGLPQTLVECIDFYGLRFFKLKVRGDLDADLDRLAGIAAVLDRIEGDYRATLDGNEQFADADGIATLWRAMGERPELARLCRAILFVEQPVTRARALETDIRPPGDQVPVEIDESDAALDAFPTASGLGYTGVSSKACKGVYKSLLNRARCAAWNVEAGVERFFMSAEDLTTQAGLAVQQDLAIAALIGCTHVERNGHHYVRGLSGLPPDEQRRWLAAHPDLYVDDGGLVRLRIADGRIAIGSLDRPGFAAGTEPDWQALREVTYTEPADA
jgi:hypothetical protein